MEVDKRQERYGFHTASGYLGKVKNKWMLFATEQEYNEYLEED